MKNKEKHVILQKNSCGAPAAAMKLFYSLIVHIQCHLHFHVM